MMQTSVIDETSAYPVLDGLACAGARLYRTWFEQTSGTVFLPMLSQASPATYPPTQHLQEA